MTDTILIDHLQRLASGAAPLIEVRANGGGMMGAEVRRTALAQVVLDGLQDAVRVRGIDRWVGGTHLTHDNVWRFDERLSHVVKS